MQIDIGKLYKKYLTLNISNRFTSEQVHQRFTETYFAERVDINIFAYLAEDPHAGFDKATAAYLFNDERGIKKLLVLNPDEYIDKEARHAYVVDSTVIGGSVLLNLEIDVFYGMDSEEMVLGNLKFEEYLIVLYILDYIQFENDPIIDQVISHYREGYYLCYFGAQDGREKYLYSK